MAGSAMFCAAIDFGTTYSGYAFSSKIDYQQEPTKIQTNIWCGSKLLSFKAPTAVLIDSSQQFIAFGYDAENKYSELIADEEYEDYYYFHRFKMLLQDRRITRDIKIKDETGKEMEALLVFQYAIQYLKDHLYKSISIKNEDIQESDMHYVLTVPAIWEDSAKQFMREAATKAGIRSEQLSIALEPEAASIYCQVLSTEGRNNPENICQSISRPGMKFMVLDLGGGTVDITVHQRFADGTLKEVVPASGGPWGGKSIDEAFHSFLKKICGPKVMEELKKTLLEDFIDLFREFETKKRSIRVDQTNKVVVTLPISLLELVKKHRGKMETALEQSPYGQAVSYNKQKLHISPDTFRDLFKSTADALIKHLERMFRNDKLSDLDTMIMVGGFSECKLMQHKIKEKFGKNKTIIIPDEAGLAVLKGAVLYGHRPKAISVRVIRRTYGIRCSEEWDAGVHPESKNVNWDGATHCNDVFVKSGQVGQQVETGHEESQVFQETGHEESQERSATMTGNKRRLFSVAIDIGTSYSGYAFSSVDDYLKTPTKISTEEWCGSTLKTRKVPTAVLLDKNKQVVAFGYEAENRYCELKDDDDHELVYYFHRFKMQLYNTKITRDVKLKDQTGKEMEALTVFQLIIKFLKDHMFKSISATITNIQDGDFQYVLTVPAIWEDSGEQFMREAAAKAGISIEQLSIALDPDVASLYCQYLTTERENKITSSIRPGMKYMVVDLGGETAHITVHQNFPYEPPKQIVPASEGPWGGISIDDTFHSFLKRIYGSKVMRVFKEAEAEDFIDLFREFESKKRSIRGDSTSKVVIRLPVSFTDIVKRYKGKLENVLEQTAYNQTVCYSNQNLLISADTFRELFDNTADPLIRHLNEKLNGVPAIIMTGGLSECEIMQHKMKRAFGNTKTIIIPDEAALAVLKGAVLYGHQLNLR